jgi:beta-lactamase superfamily II metal-dependent hydrolase
LFEIIFLGTSASAPSVKRGLSAQVVHHDEYLFLIDCGLGPDYCQLLDASSINTLSGLVLSHAHLDHWAALGQVRSRVDPRGWIAKSAATFTEETMAQQKPFIRATEQADPADAIHIYQELPSAPMRTVRSETYQMADLNVSNSSASVQTADDHYAIHKGCFVPFIECGDCRILLGTDLEAPVWRDLFQAGLLPSDIDVFQAPNHGQKHGWVDDDIFEHLAPRYVVISDADPRENDDLEKYGTRGCKVLSLKRTGDIVFRCRQGSRAELDA